MASEDSDEARPILEADAAHPARQAAAHVDHADVDMADVEMADAAAAREPGQDMVRRTSDSQQDYISTSRKACAHTHNLCC